ncbi:MAG: type 4a pilus biogenesis protein PilO [Actinobacteria bacterium]|nr:type 4a pilus biogenesis protein PilO [Actinomycetota bacterium]
MNQRARLILAIVGAVLLCLAIYFLLVRSRQGELNELNDNIAAEESRTAQLQVELERLRDLQRRAPELQAELDRFRDLVPPEDQIPNLIFSIDEAAKEAGIDFVDITPELPKPPPEGAPLAEVRMTIGADGGYFAIQDFMRRLYGLDRALRIDNLTMAGTEDQEGGGTTITLTLTARVFYEVPGATGAATGAPPNTTAPAPGTTPAPAPTP